MSAAAETLRRLLEYVEAHEEIFMCVEPTLRLSVRLHIGDDPKCGSGGA